MFKVKRFKFIRVWNIYKKLCIRLYSLEIKEDLNLVIKVRVIFVLIFKKDFKFLEGFGFNYFFLFVEK